MIRFRASQKCGHSCITKLDVDGDGCIAHDKHEEETTVNDQFKKCVVFALLSLVLSAVLLGLWLDVRPQLDPDLEERLDAIVRGVEWLRL